MPPYIPYIFFRFEKRKFITGEKILLIDVLTAVKLKKIQGISNREFKKNIWKWKRNVFHKPINPQRNFQVKYTKKLNFLSITKLIINTKNY